MKIDNSIIVDLNKVQWAKLWWQTQTSGQTYTRNTKPNKLTVCGAEFNPDEYAGILLDYPKETMLERAKRLDILDKWYPVLRLQLTANHQLFYSGKKALSIWQAWRSKIYRKQNA